MISLRVRMPTSQLMEVRKIDEEIVERVLDDGPDSPHTDDSLSTQLRTVSAGLWIVLALWTVIAFYEFVEEKIIYGIVFIFVGLFHAWTTLRTETASNQEPLSGGRLAHSP